MAARRFHTRISAVAHVPDPPRLYRRRHWQYVRRNAERDANLCIANVTTPSQYFHVLRRQVNLPHKKPLVLFTPK